MDTPEINSGTKVKQTFPQKVLIISDEHRGARITNFHAYKKNLIALASQYDHIVELGDNVELLYIKDRFAEEYGALLDVLAGKGADHWKKQFEVKKHTRHSKIKHTIRAEHFGKPEDLGILEATLNADGTLSDIQPVRMEKDVYQVGGLKGAMRWIGEQSR